METKHNSKTKPTVPLWMFLGFDNLSYTVAAATKLEGLRLVEAAGHPVKCCLGSPGSVPAS